MASKWEQLRQSICSENDKIIFDEAVRCLKAGAFRMAYIAAWISIAESLKGKLRTLAEKDEVADKILAEIETKEKQFIPQDRTILERTKEIGIIDDISYRQLEPILKMRNLFAHPYHTAPNRNETISALELAVNKVLSIPPLFNKPYIDYLLEKLEKDKHYLDDLRQRVESFAQEITPRVTSRVYPYMLKGLFFKLNAVLYDPDRVFIRNRLIWFTRAYIAVVRPDFVASQWSLRKKFEDFPWAVTVVIASKSVWSLIPTDVQDSVMSLLLYPDTDENILCPDIPVLRIAYELLKDGLL